MRQFLKYSVSGFLFAAFIVYGVIARRLISDPIKRRRHHLTTVHKLAQVACHVFDIKVTVHNPERLRSGQNYMIVSNHLSYIDGLVLGAIAPVSFITSVEMRQTFFLGLITEIAGCLFVERRSRDKIGGEIKEIEGALREGFNVVIFPEATSTNGSSILPFKRSLLAAAIQSSTPVLPLTINYDHINGQKVSPENRDLLCWYGSMGFASHFIAMLGLKKIEISVHLLPEITTHDKTREAVAEIAFKEISGKYNPIV